MLSVGCIGYSNHAARMMGLVNDSAIADVNVVYHPHKQPDLNGGTTDIRGLLDCDAVLILSPNETHFHYLQWLSENFSGYVLCEKPPVASLDQLEALNLDWRRFFFNFNQRFGPLYEIITRGLDDGSLGKPIHCSFFVTQGLAYKDSYPESWRADASRHPHGLVETKAIHYLDMLNLIFGELKHCHYMPGQYSGRGEAYDTCNFSLQYANGVTCDLLFSYAAACVQQASIIGTNGIIQFRDGVIDLYSPRDTFDSSGMFLPPPSIYHFDANKIGSNPYIESLKSSLHYFLECCREQRPIKRSLYEESIRTNRFIFELISSA